MKKMFIAFFAAVLAFTVGCGKGPEEVAQAWVDAVVAGDVDAATALSTGEGAKVGNEMFVKRVKGKEAPAFKEVKQDGDKATAKFEDGFEIPLKKVDGEWKVDFNE